MDASQLPVILYDTSLKRARQTDAENLILHILLHNQNNGQFAVNLPTLVDKINGAMPDRAQDSTRDAMKANADRVIGYPTQLGLPGNKAVFSKDEVERLHTDLDAPWEKILSEYQNPSLVGQVGTQHQVQGWEYMSLVNIPKYMPPRSIDLGKSSDGWCQYSKDLRALNLFGSNFGDFFYPIQQDTLCGAFLSFPKGDYSLSIRADTVQSLFEQQTCHQDLECLTDNGWTLQASKDPFKACDKDCRGDRIVSLVSRARKKFHSLTSFSESGVFVVRATGRGFMAKHQIWGQR